MELSLVLKKQVELSALPISDTKYRRLFILADGKRTLGELFKLCGFNATQGGAVAEVLLAEGFITSVEAEQPPVPLQPVRPAPGVQAQESITITADIAQKLETAIAQHLGPIAAILVKQNAPIGTVVTNQQLDTILGDIARHIEEKSTREQFLNKVRQSIT